MQFVINPPYDYSENNIILIRLLPKKSIKCFSNDKCVPKHQIIISKEVKCVKLH
jgi:hypothetical protein